MKKLPIDISTFKRLISENYVYVDKTQHIYNLFNQGGRLYFLARPRRFGKSLLISTLEELFKGTRELFKGLWIEKSDFKWKEHPVIRLDFSTIPHVNADVLRNSLSQRLRIIAESFDLELSQQIYPEVLLGELVEKLYNRNSVVLLIDEYDKPMLDHISNIDLAKEQRLVLKSFYDTVKALDRYWQVVFMTGVSKFSKTSIFSGINNLNDISEKPEAAELLGYTEQEIKLFFHEYISTFAEEKNISQEAIMQEMQLWYNGYRFSRDEKKQHMYNPFSVSYYLRDKQLTNYWFASGTPTFLIELLKQSTSSLADMSNIMVAPSDLGMLDLEYFSPVSLLYQTGYLTIKDHLRQGSSELFVLGYPNQEVTQSVSTYLMSILAHAEKSTVDSALFQIKRALAHNNVDLFCKTLKGLWANIPYNLHIQREAYYHSLLQHMCDLLGIDAQSEILASNGRLDLVITTDQRIFIFELKFKESEEVALQQIFDRRYYEKYLLKNKPITIIGLSFTFKNKKLDLSWVSQEYQD